MNGFRRMLSMTCCIPTHTPQKTSKLDRRAIGAPMDFRHVGHIGRSDVNSTSAMSVTDQMRSKCGDLHSNIDLPMQVVDIQPCEELNHSARMPRNMDSSPQNDMPPPPPVRTSSKDSPTKARHLHFF